MPADTPPAAMTAADFAAWRARMGFSKTAAAEALGTGRNLPAKYEAGAEIPLYIALACEALAARAGLAAETSPPRALANGTELVSASGVRVGPAADGDGVWFRADDPVAFEPGGAHEGRLRVRPRR